MSDEDFEQDIARERIDADAVCIECGTVNPEGTLLCKTCGNNLRDQRARRIAGEEGMEPPGLGEERPAWFAKGFALLGILIVLWTAINLGRIEDWLVQVQTSDLTDAEQYWSGPQSGTLDGLLAELDARPVSPEEKQLAIEQPLDDEVYDGRYVLMTDPEDPGYAIAGQANIRQVGDRYYFVAVWGRGDIELRGAAQLEANARFAVRDSAGVRIGQEYYGAAGFAQKLDGGGYECFGLSDHDEESYSVFAFRIP